jgi:hypothetical protein
VEKQEKIFEDKKKPSRQQIIRWQEANGRIRPRSRSSTKLDKKEDKRREARREREDFLGQGEDVESVICWQEAKREEGGDRYTRRDKQIVIQQTGGDSCAMNSKRECQPDRREEIK